MLLAFPGWNSVESAATYAKIFTYLGWLALFLLGVFEILAYVYGNRKDALRDAKEALLKNANAQQVSSLQSTVNSQEAVLQQQQQNIESSKADIDRVQRLAGDRFLTPDEQETMVKELSRYRVDRMFLGFKQYDSEAERFAADLDSVLARAGWKQPGLGRFMPQTISDGRRMHEFPPHGITIRVLDPLHPPPAAIALRSAIQRLGFPVGFMPSSDLGIKTDRPQDFALLIGQK